MAVRALTSKGEDLNRKWIFGKVFGTNAANRLINADTTEQVLTKGVKSIRASAQYTKGSSTSAQIEILVDGISRAVSAVSTTDGDILSANITCFVESTIEVKGNIVGTATGAYIANTLISAVPSA